MSKIEPTGLEPPTGARYSRKHMWKYIKRQVMW